MCKLANVSRSGYYNYFSEISVSKRSHKEENDLEVYKNVLAAFNFKNRKKGAKQIKMTLQKFFDINYNLKRIRRIMKKFKNGQKAYLSTILDASTNEILAHNVSKSLKIDIVTDTIDKLVYNNKQLLRDDSFIHSDQGVHYTSPIFQKRVKKNKLGQSMSRRGNCWDNAPQESFFGHLKDETNLRECETFKELIEEIDNYVNYHNNYRPQWNLKKMTPIEYRNHLLGTT